MANLIRTLIVRAVNARTLAAGAAVVALAAPAAALSQAARAATPASCAPRVVKRGPVFVFGNAGGNLRGSATRLWADGSVEGDAGDRTAADPARADSVRALARFARRSSFWATIAPRITRPTRNPDMARHFVEVHLQCGARRSLYPADAEPAAFRELFSRLSALQRSATAR